MLLASMCIGACGPPLAASSSAAAHAERSRTHQLRDAPSPPADQDEVAVPSSVRIETLTANPRAWQGERISVVGWVTVVHNLCGLDFVCAHPAGCCEICGGDILLAPSRNARREQQVYLAAAAEGNLPTGFGTCKVVGEQAACRLVCTPSPDAHVRVDATVDIVHGQTVLRVHRMLR